MNARFRPRHGLRRFAAALAVLLVVLLCPELSSAEARIPRSLEKYLTQKAAKLGHKVRIAVSVAEAATGKMLFRFNGSAKMVPASVQKILLSITALESLGAEYQFPTEIFVDALPNLPSTKGSVGNLYVRGYGDPSLTSEILWRETMTLRNRGLKSVQNIVIDDTLFIDPPGAIGAKPYQAALSAASLNHNCYAVDITPTKYNKPPRVALTSGLDYSIRNNATTIQGHRNTIILDQQPLSRSYRPRTRSSSNKLTPFDVPKVRVLLKGTVGEKVEPPIYYRTVPYPPPYFGRIFYSLLKSAGISVEGRILAGEVPAQAKLLHIIHSEELGQIVRDLNRYSSNFIAGQILFALGQDKVGYFRKDLALRRLSGFLQQLGIPADAFEVYDGSGLDKRNRITTDQLVRVLSYGYRNFSVSPEFISSLSRFGKTGTLKERRLLKETKPRGRSGKETYRKKLQKMNNIWGKTGTLNRVSAIAGYLVGSENHRLAYAIIINGYPKDAATKIENEVLRLLSGIKK